MASSSSDPLPELNTISPSSSTDDGAASIASEQRLEVVRAAEMPTSHWMDGYRRLATEAEGYRLFLSTNVSTKSSTGYSDVVERADGKYDALDYELCSLGTFETALEAAVAVAKYKAGSRPRAANVDPDVVEGYTLLRSSSTASGYAGVYQLPTGKFKASACFDGKSTHIGHFDTAIEAAVAYAKHVAQNEEESEWVDGYRLFRSTNSTGFMGVRELPNGRFEMRRRVDGRDVRIGGLHETAPRRPSLTRGTRRRMRVISLHRRRRHLLQQRRHHLQQQPSRRHLPQQPPIRRRHHGSPR